MKLRFLIILATAGIAFAGCNSNNKTENVTDSAIVDSIIPADSVVVDTTPVQDTALVDTM